MQRDTDEIPTVRYSEVVNLRKMRERGGGEEMERGDIRERERERERYQRKGEGERGRERRKREERRRKERGPTCQTQSTHCRNTGPSSLTLPWRVCRDSNG